MKELSLSCCVEPNQLSEYSHSSVSSKKSLFIHFFAFGKFIFLHFNFVIPSWWSSVCQAQRMIYDDDRGDYKLCVNVHIVCSMLVLINWF